MLNVLVGVDWEYLDVLIASICSGSARLAVSTIIPPILFIGCWNGPANISNEFLFMI
jgi:hypothetical protein